MVLLYCRTLYILNINQLSKCFLCLFCGFLLCYSEFWCIKFYILIKLFIFVVCVCNFISQKPLPNPMLQSLSLSFSRSFVVWSIPLLGINSVYLFNAFTLDYTSLLPYHCWKTERAQIVMIIVAIKKEQEALVDGQILAWLECWESERTGRIMEIFESKYPPSKTAFLMKYLELDCGLRHRWNYS